MSDQQLQLTEAAWKGCALRSEAAFKDARDELLRLHEECQALREQLGKLRDIGWKGIAEAPYPHRGMRQSLTGLFAQASDILERADGRGSSSGPGHVYAFSLRELHRNLHEMWERRGEPTVVAEFGALYCLGEELPAQELDDDDEEGG